MMNSVILEQPHRNEELFFVKRRLSPSIFLLSLSPNHPLSICIHTHSGKHLKTHVEDVTTFFFLIGVASINARLVVIKLRHYCKRTCCFPLEKINTVVGDLPPSQYWSQFRFKPKVGPVRVSDWSEFRDPQSLPWEPKR